MKVYDLKLTNDDLTIQDNDCVLVTDIDLIVQDLYNQLRCFYYTWALDFTYGSRIQEYINMPEEPLRLIQIKNEIKKLLGADVRIVKNSISVKIRDATIQVQFLPVGRSEPVSIILEAK